MCGCLLHTPYWGPGLQPRHVPWLGIKPVTLWFTGQHSIHWATPARADSHVQKYIVSYNMVALLSQLLHLCSTEIAAICSSAGRKTCSVVIKERWGVSLWCKPFLRDFQGEFWLCHVPHLCFQIWAAGSPSYLGNILGKSNGLSCHLWLENCLILRH